ncbi:M13 family peptidase [Parashewanella curva]|uniref:M13 family peptidase n=1 Tax=Parashewanella curva TaxID=2338552 RepID=A0A3L8PXX9_9GAMM|nr:M13-type metalloendopeptidase [Parashewanella curva]RLV60191.1 M13 family peptidase [Parashewanella curva]
MKNLLLSSITLSIILGLTACANDKTINTQSPSPSSNNLLNNNQVLTSGIDFKNFDRSVRPQDNFYLYVNGTWLKDAKIPSDRTSIGAFYDLREHARDDVKAIIENTAKQPNLKPGSDEQKMADLYRSFMDTQRLNALGLSPIFPEFHSANAIKSKNQLVNYFAQSQIHGGNSPMAFYIDVDAKNSNRYATHIWQSGLSLPNRDYYLDKTKRFVELRHAYLKHIQTMFELAKLPNPRHSAQTVLSLETAIAKLHWDKVKTRDSSKTYNLYQTKNLNELAPQIPWKRYLKTLGADKQKDIIINQPSFISGLGKLIQSRSLSDWKTYLTWHSLSDSANLLSEPFVKENFNFFSKALNGQEAQEPRWKRGVSAVNGLLGEIVGKVYVKQHFKPEAKTRMEQLVENLRDAYGSSIDELTWMSATTKAAARDKLAKFTPKIGYPNKWKDYSKLVIKPDDLVGNVRRSAVLRHQKALAKLNKPVDRSEWFMTPQTVNAYYNPTMNEIVFPAAILQPPFFNMAADDAVNYGGIGAVIGHEMGHGFDDQGSKYDGDGNLKNWWTPNDLSEFHKRTKELVDQFNGYYVFKDLHVNGKLTLGENIGDLSGITIAYKAYKKSLNGKPAPIIDGLTGDQRFFIGFTQIWRAKLKEKAARNRVATDPHSPPEFRSLGALSNSPAFYKAFNVKPGDKMYLPPDKRVKIW